MFGVLGEVSEREGRAERAFLNRPISRMLQQDQRFCGKVASGKNVKVLVATFVKSLKNKAKESRLHFVCVVKSPKCYRKINVAATENESGVRLSLPLDLIFNLHSLLW